MTHCCSAWTHRRPHLVGGLEHHEVVIPTSARFFSQKLYRVVLRFQALHFVLNLPAVDRVRDVEFFVQLTCVLVVKGGRESKRCIPPAISLACSEQEIGLCLGPRMVRVAWLFAVGFAFHSRIALSAERVCERTASMETSVWKVVNTHVARVSSKSAESCPEAAWIPIRPKTRLKTFSAEHPPDLGDFRRCLNLKSQSGIVAFQL